MTSENKDTLTQALQHALQYLYDPTELRKNQLLTLLRIDVGTSPLSQLRRVLATSIESLKPGSHVPPESHAWRVYNILTYRYVERMSQKETAADVALSVRQLRRSEHAAIEVLAHALKHRYKVTDEAKPEPGPKQPADHAPARENELAWLQQTVPNETMDVQALLESVLRTAAPLVADSDVSMSLEMPAKVPPVIGKLATIRQAILNILSTGVHTAPGGKGVIRVSVGPAETALDICIWRKDGSVVPFDASMVETLTVSRDLIELGEGTLTTAPKGEGCSVTLRLPNATTRQIPILIIDDNADTIQLYHRCLAPSRFHPTSETRPQEALRTATRIHPKAIILDVMLPDIDGWELLGRFREHPDTRDIPVVICTILPQEKLALALGAAAFLPKPFTQESLLKLLSTLTS